MKKLFAKDKTFIYMGGGLAIVMLEMAVHPPEVFMYVLTPLALVGIFGGLILYFSS